MGQTDLLERAADAQAFQIRGHNTYLTVQISIMSPDLWSMGIVTVSTQKLHPNFIL